MRITVLVIILIISFQTVTYGDLFNYVTKEDPSFNWEKISEQQLPYDMQRYDINLTSQTWQDITWKHRIMIINPNTTKNPTMVFLVIVGSWNNKDSDEMMIGTTLASGINAPVAILFDVPNQPLFNGLREDSLIAYTFEKVLETENEEWALLLPMTKSAVKAMDAIQQFFEKELNLSVNNFVVTGASKRGWTTWLSAVVDNRVKGICPMVYDNLSLIEQMDHQIFTWGKYSEEIDDYTNLNIPQRVKTEKGRKLAALVDPFTYRERINVPKLIVVGSNDRYWPLDAMNIYFDDLVGEKYLLRVPNKGHGIDDMQRVLGDGIAFFLKINGELTFPNLSWKYSNTDDGLQLSIDPGISTLSVSVWTAESETRDFRDAIWKETRIDPENTFILNKKDDKYSAIFGEVVYQFDNKKLFLSTEVRIIEPVK